MNIKIMTQATGIAAEKRKSALNILHKYRAVFASVPVFVQLKGITKRISKCGEGDFLRYNILTFYTDSGF